MAVTKKIIKQGNGSDKPKQGDNVAMEYTGWFYDESKPEGKVGRRFDSSVPRGKLFEVAIGTGKVIKGWDEGIVSTDGGMSLGEKASLIITPGFPPIIPANQPLIFDVELKKINNKSA
ncbi:hypothetical protein ANO11243_063930 [Dothideomycetidae sp. 11243]|nr:hypothetical protein ANO11243_063930 [fungal sp. No.11243]